MKIAKTFLIIIAFVLVTGGYFYFKAQNRTTISRVVLNTPTLTKDFETFDMELYKSLTKMNLSKLDEKEKIIYDNKVNRILPDGTYEEYYSMDGRYFTRIKPKDSDFTIVKNFYKSGNIEVKFLIFNQGKFPVGVSYFFDESGNLIQEQDNEQLFTFTIEDLLLYLERQNIFLSKSVYGQFPIEGEVSIGRTFSAEVPLWYVSIPVKGKEDDIWTIDGRTGLLVKKESYSDSDFGKM
jgi:hypothetical protein